MKRNLIIFLLLLVCTINCWKATRKFRVINKCSQTIWVASSGIPNPSPTGFSLAPGANYDYNIASKTTALRIWGRTGCKTVNNRFKCDTGDCGASFNGFGI